MESDTFLGPGEDSKTFQRFSFLIYAFKLDTDFFWNSILMRLFIISILMF